MARKSRTWHPNFLQYMKMIVNHPNYSGLKIGKKSDGSYKWLAPAKSEDGKSRIKWCKDKAKELGIPEQAGMYADVMLQIHPTKKKICQTCGKEMSLYYHYPNANFVKSLRKEFSIDFDTCDHISDIWDTLLDNGVDKNRIASFLISKGNLDSSLINKDKDVIIDALEYACRKLDRKCLGPGAMSNFPDRYDGFHSYNRCCRSKQDKGRSKENLKSYSKDRRAYEYWSDGNIHAANQFMVSQYFDGCSADHIGPISLGFVHDSHYLQPMKSSDNSSKRDRLHYEDIEKIIETFSRTKVYPMSWYSKLLWEYISVNYKHYPKKVSGIYRDALKQNFANFMYILWYIATNCEKQGIELLKKELLAPNYQYFQYSYEFDQYGNITNHENRHFTKRNKNELERYIRIAIESVFDYHEKENRSITISLNESEHNQLAQICNDINLGKQINLKVEIEKILASAQKELIQKIENAD